MALFGKNVPYFKEGQMVFPLISHLDFLNLLCGYVLYQLMSHLVNLIFAIYFNRHIQSLRK